MSDFTTSIVRRQQLQESRVVQLERMIEIRALEDRVKELFAQGSVRGTTHTCHGQEAVAVGVALAARPSDVVTCTYRGHGYALALGMQAETVLGEIMGRRAGSMRGLGGSMHLSDMSVGLLPTMAIVGAGIPIAVGAALSAQVRRTEGVAISVFGDGAANIGAFHEALNLAAVWHLPVVFICENNLYGEYSRFDLTTPISDIADRGAAYAIPSRVVDGQDVDSVNAEVADAVERARGGAGPTFLEMKTYRYAGHSRSDAASYRPEGELDQWLQRDPIEIFAARLIDEGAIGASAREEMRTATAGYIDRIAISLEAAPRPSVADLFENVLAD
jgi:acetoin:2,6-dichlorophenolindophenol oxidoreductase subunit alpha